MRAVVAGAWAALIFATAATAAAAAGARWQLEAAPGSLSGSLDGISCPTKTACTAVGTQSTSTRLEPLAESWSAGRWRLETAAQPGGDTGAGLLSVSCTSPTACVAVGYAGNQPPGRSRPLSEVLHGTTWKSVSVAGEAGSENAELASVSCEAADSCTAVGSYVEPSGRGGVLAEVYDGSTWTREQTPALTGKVSSLDGISCLTATVPALCTAVGSQTSGGRSVPLVEHDNGRQWTVVKLPGAVPAGNGNLTSVSCPQPTSCVAVGSVRNGSSSTSLSVVENELAWSSVPTPAPAAHGNFQLLGVSCSFTIESCQAVGAVGTAASATLAELWNGHAWSIQPSADPSSLSTLAAVSCATSAAPRAVCSAAGGYQPDPDLSSRPLLERS